MGYQKEYLAKALDAVKRQGAAARRRYDERRAACEVRQPRLKEIEQEIMKLGPMLGLSAISGYTDRVKGLRDKCTTLSNERDALLAAEGLEVFRPICPDCGDTGYQGTRLCGCVLRRAKELSYAALSAEMPILDCRFDNFSLDYYTDEKDRAVMEKVFAFCKRYAEGLHTNSQSLLFFGGTGLGKTHLSLAIAGAALEKGMGAIYSPVQNLLQKLEKEHFSYSAETPLQDDVFGCDLLILDDLGAEFITSFSQALIYNIINTRLLAGRPTVISTNLSLEDLAERYTPRVASRIMGCYAIKRFSGGDIRQKKRLEDIERREKA